MPPSGPPHLVVDLGYGRLRVGAAGGELHGQSFDLDVRTLLASVDAPTVQLCGVAMSPRAAWRQTFSELGLPVPGASCPGGLIIGYPSTWGAVRRQVLADVGVDSGVEVRTVPRAVLVARSHSDPTLTRCALVETSHVESAPADPVRPVDPRWDVAVLHRVTTDWGATDWAVQSSATIAAAIPDVGAEVAGVIDDGVEAVFVDGDDPTEVARAIQTVSVQVVAGRVVAVDPDLLLQAGWRTGDDRLHNQAPTADETPVTGEARASRVVKAAIAVTAAAAVVGWLALSVGGSLRSADEPSRPLDAAQTVSGPVSTGPVTTGSVSLGRSTLDVPTSWRRSEPTPAAQDGADGSTSRVVFADSLDGRRIIVVQTEVRAGSTRESVATSLRNRIAQRGDDVVREFSPVTRFAGREVISYRETPVSGSAISWYVLVESGLQVSVGCQSGTGAQSVDEACRAAVGSLRIAPAN